MAGTKRAGRGNGKNSGDGAGTGRTLRWALILSLALNLIIIGMVAGTAYRFAGGHGARGGAHAYAAPYLMALPQDERRALFRAMRRDLAHKPFSREERRAQYARVLAALRAQPFDQAALAELLQEQQRAAVEMQAHGHAAWLDRIAQMDPTARRAYADRLEEVLKRGPRRERRKPGEGEGR
jgi:uncharacterized membrane protein